MKITTFPKITENPFKKYKENDFSLKTLLNQTWKKSSFKEKKGAFIYVKCRRFDMSSTPQRRIPSITLIPVGLPETPLDNKNAKGISAMAAYRPTLNYEPLENKAKLSSFQGISTFMKIEETMMTDFLAVPDDIITNMIRYVLSQDFVEKQKYTIDVPSEEILILDGSSKIHNFILGKHNLEDINLEIFYDPKQKGFVYSVLKEDEKYPSFIYATMEAYESKIIYLEKKKKTSYTLYGKGYVFFSGENKINMGPDPLPGRKLNLIKNYFKAKNLEKLVVDDKTEILSKKEIDNIMEVGDKLKYRFHNHKG